MGSNRRLNHLYYLIAITLVGAFLRFYNLGWGDGFYFHPDEGNMARSVAQLCLKTPGVSGVLRTLPGVGSKSPGVETNCSLNPHFYAYGQFPLYLAYFSNYLTKTATTALSRTKSLIMPLYQPISHIASGSSSLSDLGVEDLEPRTASFQEAIFWLRFWSAAAGTLTILLVYLITKKLLAFSHSDNHVEVRVRKKLFATVAAVLTAFTPGLIQAAHFGTTESLLAFFFLLLTYLSLKPMTSSTHDRGSYLSFAMLGLVAGIALATKLTAAYFLITPLLAISISAAAKKTLRAKIKNFLIFLSVFFIFTFSFFIFSSPYSFLEFDEFRRISTYETEVATGKIQIFYTRQFIDTTPLLFQATKIFPYALGWPVFILGSLGLATVLFSVIQRKYLRRSAGPLKKSITLLVATAFLGYLIPNLILFAKWVRFITPIFPFFAIFAAYFLYVFSQKKPPIARGLFSVGKGAYSLPSDTLPVHSPLTSIITIFLIFLSIIPGVLFFKIYTQPDVRVAASKWIYANIPDGSYILSETGNVVDIPVASKGQSFRGYNVVSFDFYHLDSNLELQKQLVNHLVEADYIFIPSRRIFANQTRLPEQFPISTNYYSTLFSGVLGFKLVQICEKGTCSVPTGRNNLLKQIKRPSHVKIFDFVRDERSEETLSVFDHPVIRIYKKLKQFDRSYYESLLRKTVSSP